MLDPLGGFYRIREQYITYLETAFRIADRQVARERRALLERPGQLCTEPLVEPMARYQTVDWTLGDLPNVEPSPVSDMAPEALRPFTDLITHGLFDRPGLQLYTHQVEMLSRGISIGTPGIVTSGTGSGK